MTTDEASVEVVQRRFSWERTGERLWMRDHRSGVLLYPTLLNIFLACMHGDLDIDVFLNRFKRTSSKPKECSPRNAPMVSVHAYEVFMVLCETISPKDLTFKVLRQVCREANFKIKQRITVARGFCVAPFLNFLRTLPNLSEVYLHKQYYGTLVREPFESLLVSARQLTELHFDHVDLLFECGHMIDTSAVKSIVVQDEDVIRCPHWMIQSNMRPKYDEMMVYETALRWSASNGITVDIYNEFSTRPCPSHPGTVVVDLWKSTLTSVLSSVFGTMPMLRSVAFNRMADDQECLLLVNALSLCGHLRSIDLSGNNAGVHTARALAKHVECWPELQYLGLSKAFGAEDMHDIMSWVFPEPYAWTSLRVLAIAWVFPVNEWVHGEDRLWFLRMSRNVPILLLTGGVTRSGSNLGVRRKTWLTTWQKIYETF
jgi:hypothetical protein